MPGFKFDEATHTYTLDGIVLPSPSGVLQDLGLVDKRWFTEESRARGRAVHAGLHYALKGTLDWASLHPDLHGYVRSGLKLVDHLGPKILRFETPLYHPTMRFAGTFDIEWQLNDAWIWIVDWKSGKAPEVARYQTAAYAMLAKQTTPRFFKRAAIELQEDGSIANLIRYDDKTDEIGWINLLGAYRIRQSLRQSRDLAPIEIGEQNAQ